MFSRYIKGALSYFEETCESSRYSKPSYISEQYVNLASKLVSKNTTLFSTIKKPTVRNRTIVIAVSKGIKS